MIRYNIRNWAGPKLVSDGTFIYEENELYGCLTMSRSFSAPYVQAKLYLNAKKETEYSILKERFFGNKFTIYVIEYHQLVQESSTMHIGNIWTSNHLSGIRVHILLNNKLFLMKQREELGVSIFKFHDLGDGHGVKEDIEKKTNDNEALVGTIRYKGWKALSLGSDSYCHICFPTNIDPFFPVLAFWASCHFYRPAGS